MNILNIDLVSIGLKYYDIIKKLKPGVKFHALKSGKESITVNGIGNIFKKDDLHKYDFDFAFISSPSYLHLNIIRSIINLNIQIFVENYEEKASMKRMGKPDDIALDGSWRFI